MKEETMMIRCDLSADDIIVDVGVIIIRDLLIYLKMIIITILFFIHFPIINTTIRVF